MLPSETATLLAMVAAYDRRTVGQADVAAWHTELEPYDLATCTAAVRAHYGESREWLMPGDVVQRVKAIRRDRIPQAAPIPPLDPADVAGCIAWDRAWRAGCADGLTSEAAEARADQALGIVRTPVETRARPVAELVAAVAAATAPTAPTRHTPTEDAP